MPGTSPLAIRKPRLTCRIGVTGHRPKRLRANSADMSVLRQRVDEVLTAIATAVAEVRHRDAGRTPYSNEPALLRVVSPLAEGSDRLIARAGLELKPIPCDLQCVFPFATDVYRHDFIERSEWDRAGSLEEFDELRKCASAVLELDSDPAAPNAYVAVGLTTVRQSDLLLAIWDQGEPQGPGGTPEIVMEALRANVPVIGIDARRVQDHAIAFIQLRHGTATWGGWSLAELAERLYTVFALPAAEPEHEHDQFAPAGKIDLAHALFSEPATPPPATTLYARVTRWTSRLTGDAELRPLLSDDLDQLVHAPAARRAQDEAPVPGGLLSEEVQRDVAPSFFTPVLRDLVARLERAIGAAYTWTDLQASRYAALHRRHVSRSTLLLIPIAIVVGFAVQRCLNRELIHDTWPAALLRVGLSLVELGCVLAIFDSYVTVREQRYHDRWLDYRSIAEKLRHIIMLVPLGRPGIDAELPPTLGENDTRAHWTNWFVRAVTRQAGVLSGRLWDPEYRQACHALLRHWLVRGQIRYHFHAAVKANAPIHLLRKYRYLIFVFVVLSPVVDLVTEPIESDSLRQWIECFAELVFFGVPAIFGSFYAFTRLADFENIEVRSRAEMQRLTRVDRELSEQSDQSSVDLLRATSMTSHAMLAELVEWRVAAALRKPELGG